MEPSVPGNTHTEPHPSLLTLCRPLEALVPPCCEPQALGSGHLDLGSPAGPCLGPGTSHTVFHLRTDGGDYETLLCCALGALLSLQTTARPRRRVALPATSAATAVQEVAAAWPPCAHVTSLGTPPQRAGQLRAHGSGSSHLPSPHRETPGSVQGSGQPMRPALCHHPRLTRPWGSGLWGGSVSKQLVQSFAFYFVLTSY